MTDTYRTVTTRFRGLRPKAVEVDRPPARGKGTVWIPRSLLHGADDLALGKAFDGQEITFRLMAWKAEEVGWA